MSSPLSPIGWPLAAAALAAGGPEPVDGLGWLVAAVTCSAVGVALVRGRRRAVLVAEAGHELRGPLCAARLALEGVERGDARGGAARGRSRAPARGLARPTISWRRRAACTAATPWSPSTWARSRARPPPAGTRSRAPTAAGLALGGAVRGGRRARATGCASPRRSATSSPTRSSTARGTVSIAVRAEAGAVRVEVADAGPGLPAPVADLVAAGRHRRDRRGHGLAIAEGIARRHGGRLAAAPSAARGAARARAPSPRPDGGHLIARRRVVTRRRRAVVLLGLALVLGALAASDVARREAGLRAQLGPPVEVVVARATLPAGAPPARGRSRPAPRPASLRARRAPRAAGGARRAAARGAVSRHGAITPSLIDAGGPPGAPVRAGERAADVLAVGSPAVVMPGARVDVLVDARGGGRVAGGAELALEDVEVLAAAAAPAGSGGPREDGAARVAATLRVSVRQAVYLAAAQAFARELRLLARAPGDRRRTGTVSVGEGLR